MYRIMANVPDQDHIRTWAEIGTCNNITEFDKQVKEYIEHWKDTSNFIRLQQPGSFKMELIV